MEEDKYNDLKSPDKMEDYVKAIEYLSLAEKHMSKALSGKNRRGVLTDISNVAYRIKSEYLND
jgi:hypothetical protein